MTPEIDALSAKIAADPTNPRLYHARGWLHAKARRWGPAQQDFDMAVTLDPDEVEFRLSRAHLINHIGGRIDLAAGDYDHVIAREPTNARIHILRGRLFHNWHERDRAVASYDRAIQLEPDEPSHRVDRGVTFASEGQLARALADFAAAIDLDPAQPSAYIQRAFALLYENPDVRIEEVLPDLERAIELDPAVRWYRHERGYIRFAFEQWAGAAADFAAQDIPYKYSMCKFAGANVAVWYYLAQLHAGDEPAGRRFVADFLAWYKAEIATDPDVWLYGTTGDWPILLAYLLLGWVDERYVHEVLAVARGRPGLVPCEWEPIEEKILETHFVQGQLRLARGQEAEALVHLKLACGLPAHRPMRWAAARRVAELEAGSRG